MEARGHEHALSAWNGSRGDMHTYLGYLPIVVAECHNIFVDPTNTYC